MSVFNLSVNVGGTSRQNNIVGITPEQLAALIRQHEDHSETQKKLIARLETDLDLNGRQMREALRILGENDIPDEHLGAKLVEIAGHFENLRSGALADPDDSPAIVALKLDVQKAIDAGELAKADTLLEDIAVEQRHSIERSAINLAGTLARRAEIALTRLRYSEAAGHFASAAAVLPPGIDHDDKRISYLTDEASALYQQGDEYGDNASLLSAIEQFQRLVALAPRTRVPLQWAVTQNNLGNALWTLGERESGTSRLEEAVAAYRAALEEWTRTRVPLQWAVTQNNLGNALWTLGERESGTARLEEAVAAYRAALEERTRARVPLDWAMTQNNLGNALSSARRARERHGAAGGGGRRLSRGAGGNGPATRVPLDWAATQNNLGNALRALGERESGTARLEEAVAAYRAALEEWTRERVPLDWAMTQNNLGNALSSARRARERHGAAGGGGRRLSGGAGGTDPRARAARLGHDAEQSRQCAPDARRARERHGAAGGGGRRLSGGAGGKDPRARAARLGHDAEQSRQCAPSARRARERHGAAGGGGRRLSRGAGGTDPRARAARLGHDAEQSRQCALRRSASARAARRGWRRRSPPIGRRWRNGPASACRSTGPRRRTISAMRSRRSATRESGTARLEEAVAAYRAALEERTRERVPLDWADDAEQSRQCALERSASGRAARRGWRRRSPPIGRRWRNGPASACRSTGPTTQNNLGNALSTLGERESGTARLEEAVAAYRAALEERTRERVPLDWADDAEQSRQCAFERSASGRAARRGWRRRSPPIARRWRNGPASACRSTGP